MTAQVHARRDSTVRPPRGLRRARTVLVRREGREEMVRRTKDLRARTVLRAKVVSRRDRRDRVLVHRADRKVDRRWARRRIMARRIIKVRRIKVRRIKVRRGMMARVVRRT